MHELEGFQLNLYVVFSNCIVTSRRLQAEIGQAVEILRLIICCIIIHN